QWSPLSRYYRYHCWAWCAWRNTAKRAGEAGRSVKANQTRSGSRRHSSTRPPALVLGICFSLSKVGFGPASREAAYRRVLSDSGRHVTKVRRAEKRPARCCQWEANRKLRRVEKGLRQNEGYTKKNRLGVCRSQA